MHVLFLYQLSNVHRYRWLLDEGGLFQTIHMHTWYDCCPWEQLCELHDPCRICRSSTHYWLFDFFSKILSVRGWWFWLIKNCIIIYNLNIFLHWKREFHYNAFCHLKISYKWYKKFQISLTSSDWTMRLLVPVSISEKLLV